MTRSMTGYGKAEAVLDTEKMVVELRALNSKQLDIFLKAPSQMKDLEMPLRNLVSEKLQRGKVEVSIVLEGGIDKKATVNKGLAKDYHKQLKELTDDLDLDLSRTDLLAQILRMPEVLQTERSQVDEELDAHVVRLVTEACNALNVFREDEGARLSKDLRSRCKKIVAIQEEIQPLIEKRIPNIRERILKNLEQFMDGKDVDKSRFEQEMIYYLEKFDVSEEMIRLSSHCMYFMESMDGAEDCGKKLGFICQEIGREINTLGSKSYDAEMQRHVVLMKDELEKIKEQVLNVL